ncbi:pyruvate kinase [Thermodesulfovibrionales bacterium]|nr:pyruvate kinase [Thermodesulfovibrionales bacterium]MCL0071147.1 pyruvate kinase [Thermodesulfovibrionales bacterium]MCL0086305.1 pyruvate kinase [Thermodesulfovibrionales bacterium]
MRKAKIVCTIGPASNSMEMIGALIRSGMNVARLNFSHSDHDTHRKVVSYVREEALKQGSVVAVLQDLQGIKIRIGDLDGGAITLEPGEDLLLYPGDSVGNKKALFISYPALLEDVKGGDSILFDDGLIKLNVTGRTKDALIATVEKGGILRSKKGVNLPLTKTSLPAFTDKDKRDLRFGIYLDVDYVAISFVRTAEDINLIIEWAKKEGLTLPPLIAKIEKQEALDNIDEIMDITDGIMIARGDLGVEMPTERVPLLQKRLIALANKRCKQVITATQMLESMTRHTRPTRAEATDVANAVLDGTDALMLSAETAMGTYPAESVRMMDTIIKYTEAGFMFADKLHRAVYHADRTFSGAIADGACETAHYIDARAIVVFTHSGFTARLLSKRRPAAPIIAVSPDERTFRRISLYWGAYSKLIRLTDDIDALEPGMMAEIESSLVKEGLVKKGDSIVFVAGSPFMGEPNIIRLHSVQ